MQVLLEPLVKGGGGAYRIGNGSVASSISI